MDRDGGLHPETISGDPLIRANPRCSPSTTGKSDENSLGKSAHGLRRAHPHLDLTHNSRESDPSIPPRPNSILTVTRRTVLLVALFGLAIILAFPALIGLAADWLWFSEVDYGVVFGTRITTGTTLFVLAGALAFGMLYANLRFAQRGLVPDPIVVRLTPVAPALDITDRVRRLAFPISLALAFLIALGASGNWLVVQRALHAVPFGVADPVFGRDVGFYVFSLPAVDIALRFLSTLIILSLLLVGPLYWLRGDLILPPRRARVEPSAAMHLGVLIASLLVILAVRTWAVRIPGLVYSTTGPLFGVSYTDLKATLPGLHAVAITALLGAALVIAGVVRQKLVFYTAIAAVGYLAVSLLGVWLVPTAVQRLLVAPNELTKEEPYLRNHIAFTRRAWGIDSVITRDLSGEATLTLADIEANQPTIENVRLWDRDPLLQTFGQLQEIRTYYDFVSVDDDRYWIEGDYRQVLLSPRELNTQSLPQRTFINEHLVFTHGMGLTLGPVNEVTTEGLPVLFVQDLPPESDVSLPVTRPQIYFGELTTSWVIANTRQREFDYPSGEEGNVFTRYAGTGGVQLSSFWRRLLLSWHFRSLKVLLSSDVSSESRALFNRNILTRARLALPMLRFDQDPYLVLTDSGTLKWMLDAYTATNRYPYAQPASAFRDGTNYVRNSVKVVIDAYHGSIDAYIADPADPLVRSYQAIFPGIFQPLSAMTDDLRSHIRYPEDLYLMQTELYSTYHMNDPELFYHREDMWQIPAVVKADATDPFMRHIIMRLPEEEQAEFIFMVPFTPRGKDNLAAWMVARNDRENYGQLVVYRFPKQSLVFGPRQVVNRINQDTEIARQISLWSQGGSEVIRGELLVIPIEESLMYVQPMYLRAAGSRIPELKRVVIAYQNRVVMEETLDQGLARLFGGEARPRPGPELAAADTAMSSVASTESDMTADFRNILQQARTHYDRAVAAQQSGDWATYGAELRRLGELLRRANIAPGTPD